MSLKLKKVHTFTLLRVLIEYFAMHKSITEDLKYCCTDICNIKLKMYFSLKKQQTYNNYTGLKLKSSEYHYFI